MSEQLDLRETLLTLKIDELAPLEALTKLHELKRLAEAEQREEDELYKAAFGDDIDVHLTSPDGVPFIARVSPDISEETLQALGALADAAAKMQTTKAPTPQTADKRALADVGRWYELCVLLQAEIDNLKLEGRRLVIEVEKEAYVSWRDLQPWRDLFDYDSEGTNDGT